MTILLLSDHFLPNIGGGEFVVHHWAESLTRRGHTVVVATLRSSWRPFHETMKYRYHVHRFRQIPRMPLISRIIQFHALCKIYNFDVIHANFLYYAGYIGQKLQKIFAVPCVATAQGADIHIYESIGYGGLRDPKIKRRTMDVLHDLSGFTYTSKKIHDSMLELGADPSRLHYVVNGSHYDAFHTEKRAEIRGRLGVGENDIVFLCVSRRSPIKGLDLVVEAVSHLPPTNKKYKVVIAGLHTEGLRAVVRAKNVADRFEIIGTLPIALDPETGIPTMPHPIVVDYLGACDVFLAPALSGGFELSTMDAMCAGRPVIISNNIGNQDLITHGINGYLFENGNVQMLSESMGRFIETPELARTMGTYNREFCRRFDWDTIAQQLESVYIDSIKNWRGRHLAGKI